MEVHSVKCVFHSPKDAPTCIYLFGALQDIGTIDLFTDVLSEYYNYLAIEVPGSGRTEPLPPNYSYAYIAECLNRVLLQFVGKEPIRIIACSYATALAVEFAKRYPERITQLVLAGSMGKIRETLWPDLFKVMNLAYYDKSDFAEGFIDLMMSPSINQKRYSGIKKAAIRKARKYSDAHFKSFVYNTIRLMTHEVGEVRAIKAPVLVTTGEYDPFSTIEEALKLANSFTDGRFIPLSNCDHLFHIEDPQQLIDTVMLFFTRYKYEAPINRPQQPLKKISK